MSQLENPKVYFVFLLIVGCLVLLFARSLVHKKPTSSSVSVLTLSSPTPLPSPSPIPNTPYLSTYGTKLYVNGQPFQFVGVNAFSLAGLAGHNVGCGGNVENLDTFFTALRPNSVVRMWAFQGSMAINPTTKQLDWTGLDRVVKAAQKNQIKLILVLGDQSGTCDDGHWKDLNWYKTGFTKVTNDFKNGLTPLPYFEYVKQIVARYKDSTTVAMWEPVNEPEASDCVGRQGSACYTHQTCANEVAANQAMRGFFDAVGGAIKEIDHNHMISSGLVGDGQCGAVFEDYQSLHQSPGIDVASYHDYHHESDAMPGDQWNGLAKRLKQMALIQKPLMVGEVGMLAATNDKKCMNLADRQKLFKAKFDAQFAAGVVGILPWDYTNGTSAFCDFDIGANDPSLKLLHEYPVHMDSDISPVINSKF